MTLGVLLGTLIFKTISLPKETLPNVFNMTLPNFGCGNFNIEFTLATKTGDETRWEHFSITIVWIIFQMLVISINSFYFFGINKEKIGPVN